MTSLSMSDLFAMENDDDLIDTSEDDVQDDISTDVDSGDDSDISSSDDDADVGSDDDDGDDEEVDQPLETVEDVQGEASVAQDDAQDERIEEIGERAEGAMQDLEKVQDLVEGKEDTVDETAAALVTECIASAYRALGRDDSRIREMYSPESYSSRMSRGHAMRLAMESVGLVLQEAWASLIKFIKKVWEFVKTTWDKLLGLLGNRRSKMRSIVNASKSLKDKISKAGTMSQCDGYVAKYNKTIQTGHYVPTQKRDVDALISLVVTKRDPSKFLINLTTQSSAYFNKAAQPAVKRLSQFIKKDMNEQDLRDFDKEYDVQVTKIRKFMQESKTMLLAGSDVSEVVGIDLKRSVGGWIADKFKDIGAAMGMNKSAGAEHFKIVYTKEYESWKSSGKTDFSGKTNILSLDYVTSMAKATIDFLDYFEEGAKALRKQAQEVSAFAGQLKAINYEGMSPSSKKAQYKLRSFTQSVLTNRVLAKQARVFAGSVYSTCSIMLVQSMTAWREAYKQFGSKKSKSKASNESFAIFI